MANPYHDGQGRFCSRDEMGEAIDNAISTGQVEMALSLKADLADIDAEKIANMTPSSGSFYSGETFTYNQFRFSVAEPGCSGTVCMRCRYNLTMEESDVALYGDAPGCPNCKAKDDGAVFLAAITKEHVKFFDKDAVRETTWFHATTSPEWHSGLLSDEEGVPLVHLGTLDTAMDRANDVTSQNPDEAGDTWYLHEITLNDSAPISDHMMPDHNEEAPEYADETDGDYYSTDGITRYINGYERAGEVSLLANVNSFKVTSTKTLN